MSDAGYSMLGTGEQWWPREMLWGGRWEGAHVWERMYTRGWFMSMYGKTNLKKKIKKKNKEEQEKKKRKESCWENLALDKQPCSLLMLS